MNDSEAYRGVTKTPVHYQKSWRGQIVAGGKCFALGLFDDVAAAARAFDNAAFYLTAAGLRKPTRLNFPDEEHEGPTARTQEILDEVKGLMKVVPEPVAKRVYGIEQLFEWIDKESAALRAQGDAVRNAMHAKAAALIAFRDKISGKSDELEATHNELLHWPDPVMRERFLEDFYQRNPGFPRPAKAA